MAFPVMRTALAAIAALAVGLAAQAGEFARPVPSDAQVTRFTRFNIRYSLRDVIADGVQKVDFYWTKDMGATWELYGEDPDRISPMTVEVPGEGVYGFVCVATDRNGNRELPPVPRTRPETVIIVDRTPPQAKWLSPKQDVLGRGQPVELSWESSDDYFSDTPVKLQYAVNAQSNHDRSANWTVIEENLPANGSHKWTPPDSNRYNFRLVAEDRAGNMAVAYNAATISIDNTAPYIQSVSPLRSNKLENEIAIEASDGANGSGVKEFSLYTSDNGAATWTLVKETDPSGESAPVKRKPGETILFKTTKSGEYPLWPVVFDEAGNATSLPVVAVAGPYVLIIDNEPPVVTLSNSFLLGRSAVLANDSRRVEWTSYDAHIENYSASIHLSLDNGQTWQELLSQLPTSGAEYINFPFGSESEEAKIRVTVRDEFGNVGEGVSEAFKLTGAETTIDTVTPRGDSGASSIFDSQPQPATPDWGGTPSPAPVFIPEPAQQFPTAGSSNIFDPIPSASVPSTPEVWNPGNTSTTDIFDGPTTDIYNPSYSTYGNESTAQSVPRAMLRDTQQPALPPAPVPAPPLQTVTSLPPQQQESPWMPSPGAGSTSQPSGQMQLPALTLPLQTSDSTSAQPQTDAAPASPLGDWRPSPTPAPVLTPTPPPASAALPTPPAAATTPSAPETPSLAMPPPAASQGSDLFGSDVLAPPPMPGASSAQSQESPSPFGNMDGFPSLGAPLSLPPMPQPEQASAAPQPETSSALRPQSTTTPAITPPSEARLDSTAPAAQPPSMPTLPGAPSTDIALPAPLDPPTARPMNSRQESNRLVKESKGFREDGMMEMANDRAVRAVETDPGNAAAYMELSQVNARLIPPDFARAANAAKEATTIEPTWETWWNCADVYYIWSHTTNKSIQEMFRGGRTPSIELVDERNSTLNNAMVAISNAEYSLPKDDNEAKKKVTVTSGMVAYLRALTIPEPARPTDAGGMLNSEYSRQLAAYKTAVMPLLLQAMPHFQKARTMSGPPAYPECFQLGVINFRLAGLERDSGNTAQAVTYYQEAVKFLLEAVEAPGAPTGGPREAYYMLALSHDELSKQPGADQTRNKEAAFRYWRQTADFYEAGSAYRSYAEQRLEAIGAELGL